MRRNLFLLLHVKFFYFVNDKKRNATSIMLTNKSAAMLYNHSFSFQSFTKKFSTKIKLKRILIEYEEMIIHRWFKKIRRHMWIGRVFDSFLRNLGQLRNTVYVSFFDRNIHRFKSTWCCKKWNYRFCFSFKETSRNLLSIMSNLHLSETKNFRLCGTSFTIDASLAKTSRAPIVLALKKEFIWNERL